MGTRTSVISICKEPALTKARLPEAAARILHARPLAPRPRSPRSLTCPSSAAHAAPSPPRPAGAPRTESAATPCSRPAGTATAEPWPQRGNPSLSRCRGRPGAQGLAEARGQPEASAHPQAAGRGSPGESSALTASRGSGARRRRGDHDRGSTRARTRRRWQRDSRAQRARLPARLRPPEALDAGEEGPGPARGGGARATPARARLLLRGPRSWGR